MDDLLDHRLSFQAPTFPGSGLSLKVIAEPIELVVDPPTDGVGARREGREHVLGNTVDLGDSIDRLTPPHAKAAGQLGAQAGVVDGAEGALIELDGPGVERQPSAVWRPHPIGDHDVRVKLGIERPTRVLAEDRGDDPLGVEHGDLAVDAVAGVGMTLDPVDHHGHGGVMGVEDLLAECLVSKGEEH